MAKRKMTPTEQRKKKKRHEEFTTIFIKGKQKRVKRRLQLMALMKKILLKETRTQYGYTKTRCGSTLVQTRWKRSEQFPQSE